MYYCTSLFIIYLHLDGCRLDLNRPNIFEYMWCVYPYFIYHVDISDHYFQNRSNEKSSENVDQQHNYMAFEMISGP